MIKMIILGLLLVAGLTASSADKVSYLGNLPGTQSSGKEFHAGVYTYVHRMRALAVEQGKNYSDLMGEHLAKLASLGIDSVYLGGVSSENFDENLQLATRYHIKLVPQLDFVYFRENWDSNTLEATAKVAAAFINKYKGNPQILAWSVMEEPAPNIMDKLSVYYQKILELAPEAKFYLHCSILAAMKNMDRPFPSVLSAGIYMFQWEVSGGGWWISPSAGLTLFRNQVRTFSAETFKKNTDFSLVITADAMAMPIMANRISDPERVDGVPKDQKETYIAKCKKFAVDGRMGWGHFEKDGKTFYNVWKYYHPPTNCVKAMIWTGVMEGARSIFFWMYSPQTKADSEMTLESSSYSGKAEVYHPMGRDSNQIDPELKEYSETIKELSPYGKIIVNMAKLPETPVKSETKNIFNNAFSCPGINGRIAVLHNAEVGTWPANDQIFIDGRGNLKDYKPFTNAVIALCEVALVQGEGVYDLANGEEIKETELDFKFVYPIKIMPGSGKFIFIGTRDQFSRIYKQMQH